METYIDRIKKMKAERKLTNDHLSELSGIPLGTLSKLMAGMSESPKLSNIVAICNALDCSVDYIVTGNPENTNNYTLSKDEIRMMEQYRELDRWGRELTGEVIAREAERIAATRVDGDEKPTEKIDAGTARILKPIKAAGRFAGAEPHTGKRTVMLYELPVSAGVGVYLDDSRAERVSIPNSEKTAEADYALRISGNSMEPKYHNGDVLLVQNAESVEVGEAGIFLLDGNGFFKIYGGDRLISLNPEYGPILLKDFDNVQCRGRVIGRLRRK